MMAVGNLTGSAEAKYFSQVLLGLTRFNTFPLTENLMPDGSVTVVIKFSFDISRGDSNVVMNLLYFLISSKSARTSLGDSCNDFESLGINSAWGRTPPDREVELSS